MRNAPRKGAGTGNSKPARKAKPSSVNAPPSAKPLNAPGNAAGDPPLLTRKELADAAFRKRSAVGTLRASVRHYERMLHELYSLQLTIKKALRSDSETFNFEELHQLHVRSFDALGIPFEYEDKR